MIWVRAYVVFWMCFCAYYLFHFLRTARDDADGLENELSDENIVRTLDMLRAALSPQAILCMAGVMCLFLMALDAAGFILVFTHTMLRSWELGVFLVAAVAAIYDHISGAAFLTGSLRTMVCSDKPSAVLVRYLGIYRPQRTWKAYAAGYGKLIVSVYGALWACFG
ncbi:MAG: hypothetical protein IJ812_04955 [Schwartzia sp.]|nr:hypothetical protein [Schwartzia sp. (in: firmicutes)]MBR1885735.1 hypothetical protein [Schwartzia sp. (in: firmicutes)]